VSPIVKPSSHEKLQVSPGVGISSSPSEQLIEPNCGASNTSHSVVRN